VFTDGVNSEDFNEVMSIELEVGMALIYSAWKQVADDDIVAT
jgi:hypothetical protein